jgi:hypothetical protein
MSAPGSKRIPLWTYGEPPAGLSADFDRIYRALIDPGMRIAAFRPDDAIQGTHDRFAAWTETLQRSEAGARAVLQFLHGPSERTWRAGQAILAAIAPIGAMLCSATRFMASPTPTRDGNEATIKSLRADIADKLSNFDVAYLAGDLAAAVVADCAAQRGQPAAAPIQSADNGTAQSVILHSVAAKAIDSNLGDATVDWQALLLSPPLSAAQIADKLGQPVALVERTLRNFRNQHDFGFITDEDAGVGEARFRYKMDDVLSHLQKWYRKRQKKAAKRNKPVDD